MMRAGAESMRWVGEGGFKIQHLNYFKLKPPKNNLRESRAASLDPTLGSFAYMISRKQNVKMGIPTISMHHFVIVGVGWRGHPDVTISRVVNG